MIWPHSHDLQAAKPGWDPGLSLKFCYFVEQSCFLRDTFVHFLFSSWCTFYPLLCINPSPASELSSSAPRKPIPVTPAAFFLQQLFIEHYSVPGTVLGTWASQ